MVTCFCFTFIGSFNCPNNFRKEAILLSCFTDEKAVKINCGPKVTQPSPGKLKRRGEFSWCPGRAFQKPASPQLLLNIPKSSPHPTLTPTLSFWYLNRWQINCEWVLLRVGPLVPWTPEPESLNACVWEGACSLVTLIDLVRALPRLNAVASVVSYLVSMTWFCWIVLDPLVLLEFWE